MSPMRSSIRSPIGRLQFRTSSSLLLVCVDTEACICVDTEACIRDSLVWCLVMRHINETYNTPCLGMLDNVWFGFLLRCTVVDIGPEFDMPQLFLVEVDIHGRNQHSDPLKKYTDRSLCSIMASSDSPLSCPRRRVSCILAGRVCLAFSLHTFGRMR